MNLLILMYFSSQLLYYYQERTEAIGGMSGEWHVVQNILPLVSWSRFFFHHENRSPKYLKMTAYQFV